MVKIIAVIEFVYMHIACKVFNIGIYLYISTVPWYPHHLGCNIYFIANEALSPTSL